MTREPECVSQASGAVRSYMVTSPTSTNAKFSRTQVEISVPVSAPSMEGPPNPPATNQWMRPSATYCWNCSSVGDGSDPLNPPTSSGHLTETEVENQPPICDIDLPGRMKATVPMP